MTGSASAPGSSGNLGPGFDVLGLAVDLRCRVTVSPSSDMTVDDGEGPQPLAADHMVHRAVQATSGTPMAIVVDNSVPRARGLGSSAAVTAAAAAATVRASGGEPDRQEIYEIVAGIEGHGDNAGPAVYGGLVAVGVDGPRSLPIDDRLVTVFAVPHTRLATIEARAALPELVTLGTATRSVSRAVSLADGLRTGDRAALAAARGDELHEVPRAALSPVTGSLIEAALSAGAKHAAWSGAGPTAIAFTSAEGKDAVMVAMTAVLGDGGDVMVLDVDYEGLK
ncbi:MAG: homoserine kinase [Acidimicrobiia bacterium]|nr:MAG: homoserine kinase [Acidimicrobiia bacterium]